MVSSKVFVFFSSEDCFCVEGCCVFLKIGGVGVTCKTSGGIFRLDNDLSLDPRVFAGKASFLNLNSNQLATED